MQLPGWHTSRKILVIQSDDWGSIRMPSNEAREALSKFTEIETDDSYNRYDTLASTSDLNILFDCLSSVEDVNGNSAVLTPNVIMANPDFGRITASDFKEYHWEPLETTFGSYNNLEALKLWKEGMGDGVFCPQFHGREHVNVHQWMAALRNDVPGVRTAFSKGVFGAQFPALKTKKNNFQRGWMYHSDDEGQIVSDSIKEGTRLFEQMFGFRSISTIPPAYTWGKELEKAFMDQGIQYIQSIVKPNRFLQEGKMESSLVFTKPSKEGKVGYIQRNAFFEPSNQGMSGQLSTALERIDTAFRWNKPAILSTHRINFIGGLDEKNRDENIKEFRALLKAIVSKWPNIEFMSTQDLIKVMTQA